MKENVITKQYNLAKKEGRICKQCGWIITKKFYADGNKICANCYVANKGVDINSGAYPYADEPTETTGET